MASLLSLALAFSFPHPDGLKSSLASSKYAGAHRSVFPFPDDFPHGQCRLFQERTVWEGTSD